MRSAFIKTLVELAERDETIWLLTGDLGYSVLEVFAARFPHRYVNVGVAEQNMTGIAAGLAMSGLTVFTYSIANFSTIRCLEQIRNDVCYHNLNVNIVAVGGGVAYGSAGYTHHALEDLAVMRAMPNLSVVAPGDPIEVRLATRTLAESSGPSYLRLGRGGEAVVHQGEPDFRLGTAIALREGGDVTLISTGGMLRTVVAVADILSDEGIAARVLSMHTVKPLDTAAVRAAATNTGLLAVVEDHSDVGGLYSAITSALGAHPTPCLSFAFSRSTEGRIGSQEHLTKLAGLTPPDIAAAVAGRLRSEPCPSAQRSGSQEP
ncbi:MAG: transketolase C-terminal domain-containing protein [Actinomycetota bacterium]